MLAAQMQELLNLARIHYLYEAEAWIEDNFPGLATSHPNLLASFVSGASRAATLEEAAVMRHVRQEDTGHGRPR